MMKAIPHLTVAAALSLTTLDGYDLHEWGTFTTVAGSDGVILTGLEREEEALPQFVRHHPGFINHHPAFASPVTGMPVFYAKRIPIPVKNVKVKMETPVIYFHAEEAFKAKVTVGFEGGTISQWYPNRSGGEVLPVKPPSEKGPVKILDLGQSYSGSIEWDIDVLSRAESQNTILFKPDDLLQWTRARVPEANVVRDHEGETEGFLFYRGLGSFEPGLKTTISQDETLQLENRTGGDIPYLLIYERKADGTHRWTEHHGLINQATVSFSEAHLDRKGTGKFDADLYRSLTKNLAAQGLLESEAQAMVETWWQSYFAAPGFRVFWVLPDAKIDAILPLKVTPAPENTVRVLVGRSELIRPRQESEWLVKANSKDETLTQQWNALTYGDRFGLAYLKRIRTLQQQAKN